RRTATTTTKPTTNIAPTSLDAAASDNASARLQARAQPDTPASRHIQKHRHTAISVERYATAPAGQKNTSLSGRTVSIVPSNTATTARRSRVAGLPPQTIPSETAAIHAIHSRPRNHPAP